MNTIKQTIIIVMLGFFALGISGPPIYADTLSDLRMQCYQACHDIIVSPSGWVLSGTSGAGAKTPAQKTLAEWGSTMAAMGDGKCGFITIGPGGTSRSVGAQYLLDKQNIPPPTPTFISTPTVTYTPTPTSMCIWATPVPTPIGGCVGGYVALSAPYCPENVFVCFTPTATPTPTYTPTPTLTATPTCGPTYTALFVPPGCSSVTHYGPTGCMLYNELVCPTPTPVTPTPTPTATSSGPHTWYDYDYQGGRCFQKDHSIQDTTWCEQHGKKGGGNHPSLDGYHRHAHLDYPGQKP